MGQSNITIATEATAWGIKFTIPWSDLELIEKVEIHGRILVCSRCRRHLGQYWRVARAHRAEANTVFEVQWV